MDLWVVKYASSRIGNFSGFGPRRPDPGRFGLSRECRAKGAVGSGSGTGWEGVHRRDQAIGSR